GVPDARAQELEAAAFAYDMDVLLEVHDEAELERALKLRSRLVGINNRDLRTFETTLATTKRLAPRIPAGRITVSESGIFATADLDDLATVGVRTFLVGESLMRQADVAVATRTLLGRPQRLAGAAEEARVARREAHSSRQKRRSADGRRVGKGRGRSRCRPRRAMGN